MKLKLKKTTLLTLGILALAHSAPAWSEEENEREDERQEESSTSNNRVIEGTIIKVKIKNNEIYVKSNTGKREEIYLEANAQITDGTKQIKLSDLKKDTKVKVSGKSKVEVLK